MITIKIREAKTNFLKLIDAVIHGEEIIIIKAGRPVAKLVPIINGEPKREPGTLKGKIRIATDFDAPLPDDLINQFQRK